MAQDESGNQTDPQDTKAAQPDPPKATEPSGEQKSDDGTDWKAEARKWEKRAKDNSDAAARLKEIEERDKTDAQRAADKAASAEDRAETAELKALRLEVAFEKGLTPAQAKRLVGASREELEADADDLLATFQSDDDRVVPASRIQGESGDAAATTDMNRLIRRAAGY